MPLLLLLNFHSTHLIAKTSATFLRSRSSLKTPQRKAQVRRLLPPDPQVGALLFVPRLFPPAPSSNCPLSHITQHHKPPLTSNTAHDDELCSCNNSSAIEVDCKRVSDCAVLHDHIKPVDWLRVCAHRTGGACQSARQNSVGQGAWIDRRCVAGELAKDEERWVWSHSLIAPRQLFRCKDFTMHTE